MQIKCKSITVYIKNKKGEMLTSLYQKEFFTLNMFPKNKQKIRQTKKDAIKEKSSLNYKPLENMLSVSLSSLFIFHQINLINIAT